MMDMIAMGFGITMVSLIVICLGWSVCSYIYNSRIGYRDQNKKLLENMKKFK